MKGSDRIYEMHAELCKTLASPIRLRILNELRGHEETVSRLAEKLGIKQANLSQHLAVLRQRHVVTTRRDGPNIYYQVANPKMTKAHDLIREVLLEQVAEARLILER